MSVSGVEQREAPSNIETVTNRRQVSRGVDLEHQFQSFRAAKYTATFLLSCCFTTITLGNGLD